MHLSDLEAHRVGGEDGSGSHSDGTSVLMAMSLVVVTVMMGLGW